MIIMRCYKCQVSVDTDEDPDAVQPDPRYSLKPHPDVALCAECRARAEGPIHRQPHKGRASAYWWQQ